MAEPAAQQFQPFIPASQTMKEFTIKSVTFGALFGILLGARCYVGIATHDDVLINGAKKLIEEMKLARSEYEFQMLLGVRSEKRNELIRDGHRLRVYTPYGKQWYAYSVRRLKENPQMAGYVFKQMLGME